MLLGEGLYLKDPAFGVTKAYEKDRRWPIALDWGDFHPVRKGHTAKNACFYPEMRADWMMDISASELRKFVEDMVRYSGRGTPGSGSNGS
jgi:hypothetical protein